MHFVRRAALRAASATSFKTRTINTASPFLLKASNERLSSAVFRRFASDDANYREEHTSLGDAHAQDESYHPVEDTGYGADARDGVSRGFVNEDRPLIEPNSGIYIGNLLFDITEEDLRREFEHFGAIKDIRLTRDSRGLSKGFAYIEFADVKSATAAIEAKNQTIFEGRRLVVNYINLAPKVRDQNPPSKCLFIGNLAFEMSDSDLNSLFREVRNVIDVRVAIDRRTGQPRGFAHADFVDVESAMKALEQLQGKEVFNRKLRVDFSTGDRVTNQPGRRGAGAGGYGAGGAGGYGGGQGSYGGGQGSYGGGQGSYGGGRGNGIF